MAKIFDLCLPIILHHEGGYVNHPKDPGGMTNLGITKRVYEEWVGRTVTEAEMRALTPTMVAPIYKRNYWDKLKCDDLPLGLDLVVFDYGVNAGIFRSARTLQRLVGVPDDAMIGMQTISKVNQVVAQNGGDSVIRQFSDARRSFYRSLSTFPTFGRGWLRRVDEIEAKAVNMN